MGIERLSMFLFATALIVLMGIVLLFSGKVITKVYASETSVITLTDEIVPTSGV